MQIKMINANGSVWVVKREFKADSWFVQGLFANKFTAEEVCEAYHVEKLLRDSNNTHFLVNEVSEAQIVTD
jgi:phenylpyruvate tautomerase PptA (4-oxalocrotonate tautomerase family)